MLFIIFMFIIRNNELKAANNFYQEEYCDLIKTKHYNLLMYQQSLPKMWRSLLKMK